MCGIAGFSGDFDCSLLERMSTRLAHRGPDDSGLTILQEKGIGLAHRRLSIIDLSPYGHQPMWDVYRRAVITFNGEIYNYRELREDLSKDGFIFKSKSDTEVLLNLYLRDGKAMLSVLNGIFAFAIYDTRNNVLFLARDGLGVKPLYYAETSQGVLFASELKALLQEPSIERNLDYDALLCYMTYLWAPAPRTMLKSVRKLEPGRAMLVKDGRIQERWKFYDLPYNQPINKLSEKDAIVRIQELVRQAVKRQIVADVPVGAFLSGGLDSSAIVNFAREFTREKRLQCFTIGFKDKTAQREGMVEDLLYAKRVAEYLGVTLNTIYVESSDMATQIERMIYYLDEPQADPAPINALFISRMAREQGIKVLLSGVGGDDIFSGYRRHYALMHEKYWVWMPEMARRGIRKITEMLPVSIPLYRRITKAFHYADCDADERMISYFYWLDPDLLRNVYSSTLKEELASISPSMPLRETLATLPDSITPLNRMLYLEGRHFLTDHNLNYTDKMSMAAGVEVRVPLLDPDLIFFAAQLPLQFKQRGKTGKWVFKKAMEPFLPKDLIFRPKTGFGAPLRSWLKHELRSLVDDILSEDSIKRRGLFDVAGVKRLLYLDKSGQIDGAYTILSLLCIELWCRIFLDRK